MSDTLLQPEPLLPNPSYLRDMALSGHGVPAYAYALNNPLYYVDRDGNSPGAIVLGGEIGPVVTHGLGAAALLAAMAYCINTGNCRFPTTADKCESKPKTITRVCTRVGTGPRPPPLNTTAS